MRTRLRAEGSEDVAVAELTWADKLIQQGIEQGSLATKREMLLQLVRTRLGAVESFEHRVATADAATLDRVFRHAMTANTIDEILAEL